MDKRENSFWRTDAIYWVAVSALVASGGYWYWSSPSGDAKRREQVCKDWGFTDEGSLARCRESQEESDIIIGPKVRQAALKAVSAFDQQLGALTINKTIAKTENYKSANIGDISKTLGGIAPILLTNTHFPLEGARLKLVGRLITNTPDPNDEESAERDNAPAWQPQTYQLWSGFSKAKNVMPIMIDLDIESLNRDERQFIRTHCEIVSLTQCNAIVWGHVGRISENENSGFQYRGIVVEQIDIRPIDPINYKLP